MRIGEDPRTRSETSVADVVYQAMVSELSSGSPSGGRDPDSSLTVIADRILDEAPLLPPAEVERLAQGVTARLHGLGPIEVLLSDPSITEVMINGPGVVWIERAGRVTPTEVVVGEGAIGVLIERIVAPLGLRADRSSPMVDARLPDGSRVNIVVPPLAVDGPYVTVRRFLPTVLPIDRFGSAPEAQFLRAAVQRRKNLIVSGGTGAGKTSLLNALGSAIPPEHRVVTIEDTAELQLPGDHVVRLEARPANAEGVGAITIRQLVRNALRMRPDRILVGEVRGAEALDMVQAMNTGHEGSLSSCHASSAADALRRLETMMLQADADLSLDAVRDHLRAAVDLIVQLRRGADGRRRITEITRVDRAGIVPVILDPGSAGRSDAP